MRLAWGVATTVLEVRVSNPQETTMRSGCSIGISTVKYSHNFAPRQQREGVYVFKRLGVRPPCSRSRGVPSCLRSGGVPFCWSSMYSSPCLDWPRPPVISIVPPCLRTGPPWCRELFHLARVFHKG